MKRTRFTGLWLGLLAFGALCGSGLSQAPPVAVVADVPFSFTVENTTLPAGKYEFTRVDPDTWEFAVVNAKGDTQVLFLTEPTEAPTVSKASELIFNVYGDRHFLSKVYVEGELGSYYVAKDRTERAYMKQEATKTQRVPAKKKM